MPERASRVAWAALVAALFCAPLFVGLGAADLQNDEAIYSFAVDRMLETGEWLVPASSPHDDLPFLEKPPLKFWIVAVPIRLGLLPHDELGLRFWDALFGAIAFLYVFGIGSRLAHPACGFVAVLTLFIHQPLLFEHGLRSNNMEAALLLAYSGGVYHFLAWAGAERRTGRQLHAVAVSLWFVLGFMTKFVAAIFLPAVLCAATLLVPSVRARAARDAIVWLGGGLIAAGLLVPWFVYVWWRFGHDVWRIMLGQHVYTRFTSYLDETHLNPWHYYFSTAYLELHRAHPGLPLAAAAGLALLAIGAFRRSSIERVVVLLWFALPLAMISFGSSKLYHYAYPFLPPLGLAAGYVLALLLRAVRAPVDRVAAAVDRKVSRLSRRLPALFRHAGLIRLFLAGAALAGAVAVGTALFGPIRVRAGEAFILRNSSVLRPALVALALMVLADGVGRLVRLTPLIVLFAALPVLGYLQILTYVRDAPSPLRSIRDCILRVRAESPGTALPSALYVEVDAERLYAPVNYYLRRLAPWESPGRAVDARLFDRLYRERGPALVSDARYEAFSTRVRKGDPVLLAEPGDDRAVADLVRARARQAGPLAYEYADVLVLLPGPYAACYPESR